MFTSNQASRCCCSVQKGQTMWYHIHACIHMLCHFLSFFEMPHMLTYIKLWSYLPHRIHDMRINKDWGGGGDAKSYVEFSLLILQKNSVYFYPKPFLLLSLITILLHIKSIIDLFNSSSSASRVHSCGIFVKWTWLRLFTVNWEG